MGKDGGFLTPKAISNRIKSKGLQKLRWYCEMCQKQCRDEAGFRNHLLSESHNRQMQLFVGNSRQYVEQYSREFQGAFVSLLRRGYGTKRVLANRVYQDFISDKNHTHLNATRWTTVAGFVQHLGRQGIVTAEETEKGWFITYIDRDPIAVAKQEAIERELKAQLDESERARVELDKQIERSKEANPVKEVVVTEFKRENDDEKATSAVVSRPVGLDLDEDDSAASSSSSPSSSAAAGAAPISFAVTGDKRKRSNLEDIMAEQEAKKEKIKRKDYWLAPGIVVKVMSKQLAGGKYYKQKGVVLKVIENYVGEVELNESGDIVRLDQQFLETVIPNVGGKVRIVNGAYRDEEAVLESVDIDNFKASVRILKGYFNDRVVDVPYEDFSKLA